MQGPRAQESCYTTHSSSFHPQHPARSGALSGRGQAGRLVLASGKFCTFFSLPHPCKMLLGLPPRAAAKSLASIPCIPTNGFQFLPPFLSALPSLGNGDQGGDLSEVTKPVTATPRASYSCLTSHPQTKRPRAQAVGMHLTSENPLGYSLPHDTKHKRLVG